MQQQGNDFIFALDRQRMTDEALFAAEAILISVEKYGLDATKAEIAFERAKSNLVKAYSRLQRLHHSHS